MLSRLMLPVTYRCNLNCEYCYVDKSLEESISLKTALSAVDFLMENNRQDKKPVDIVFIGGEPLIEWRKIMKIVFYAKQSASKMGLTIANIGFPTNGLLLDEKILDFCRKEKIKVAVSIDGLENKRRLLTGENSFHFIEKKIPMLLRYRDVVRIKLTVHPDYVEKSLDIFKKFLKLGFVKIDMQPVSGVMWTSDRRNIYLKNLKESFIELRKAELKNKSKVDMKNFRDFVNRDQHERTCPKVKEEFLIDINGNVYPCAFYLSIPVEKRQQYSIGNIGTGIDIQSAKECMRHKICDQDGNQPALKAKCQSCAQSQACYKVCLGYDFGKKKFDSKIAVSGWMLFRGMEEIYKEQQRLID